MQTDLRVHYFDVRQRSTVVRLREFADAKTTKKGKRECCPNPAPFVSRQLGNTVTLLQQPQYFQRYGWPLVIGRRLSLTPFIAGRTTRAIVGLWYPADECNSAMAATLTLAVENATPTSKAFAKKSTIVLGGAGEKTERSALQKM